MELVEIPQSTSALGLVDGTLYQETTVNVAGVSATAVTPRNGFGTYRLDWVRAGTSYSLLSQRLDTLGQGTSGLPMAQLVTMAASVA